MLLTVEDDKRIKENRSPHDAESQKVVEFYYCDNHQTQGLMITQVVKLLVKQSSGEKHKKT